MSLDGQRVVIIGGSSGIGLAIARRATEAGALVTIAGRSEERLREASRLLGGVPVARVDIASESDVNALFEPLDRVDHLVVTAGTVGRASIVTSSLDSLRSVVEQRLWGPLFAIRAAAPKMQGGSITLTSGGVTSRPAPGRAITVAALGAVEALARGLAIELAPIRVNCIAPGAVATPLQGTGPETEARLREVGGRLPSGRVGTAEDLAEVYLLAMTNGYLTGELLHVDGGGRFV